MPNKMLLLLYKSSKRMKNNTLWHVLMGVHGNVIVIVWDVSERASERIFFKHLLSFSQQNEHETKKIYIL